MKKCGAIIELLNDRAVWFYRRREEQLDVIRKYFCSEY
jgi:hypothetical protein